MVFSSDYRPLPDRIIEFRLISYRKLSTRECWRFPDATTTTRRCQDCWLNVRSVSFPCHRVFYISHRWVDGFSTFHSFGVSTHYLFPMLAYGFEPTTTTITPPARSCRSNRCFFSFFCFVSFFFFFFEFSPQLFRVFSSFLLVFSLSGRHLLWQRKGDKACVWETPIRSTREIISATKPNSN